MASSRTSRPDAGRRRARRIAVVAAAVGVALTLGWIFGRDQVFPKRFVEVEPGRLYRSGRIEAHLLPGVLARNDIRVVLDLTFGRDDEAQGEEREIARRLGVDYVNIPLHGDARGGTERYARAVARVARAVREGDPVLVHCAAGARRSAAVVALYEVLVEGLPSEQAYAELDRFGSRPVAESPILPFLNQSMGAIAERLVELGVLPAVPSPLPKFEPS